MKKIYIIVFAASILFGCKNSRTAEPKMDGGERQNFKTQNEIDAEIISKYVADKKLNGKYINGGIYAVISDSGKGENPTVQSTVSCFYKGYFLTGNVFDQTKDGKPAEFSLTQVIEGWKIAIPTLKRGGKGTFIIPSTIAYGPGGNGIPANSVLVFDVELVDFK